ncbi:Helix-turn-helix domain protein [compost metagenome]|uniref:TniQ family protein n=1 Tax=Pseudomonas TaxID=286 RepID=UPI0003FBDDD9|nr:MULTISPECIES: TniQ family protein [Pseudomonas]MCW2268916.1 hypothetical protein [Pseudomonas sp. JUb96]
MFGLLVNATPKCDESLVGYLHRLGDCNALRNGEVVKLFKELTDEQVYEWLDEDVRPVSWHEVVTVVRSPKFTNQKIWSLVRSKFCPVCFVTELYWREVWELTLYTTCSIHKVELLYGCPKCQAKINQKILITKFCDICGFSFSDVTFPTLAADESKVWMSVELEKRLRQRSTENTSGVESLTYEQLHLLAVRVGVRALSRKHFMNMTVSSMACRNVAPDLAQAAGQILSGWPGSFHDLLTDLIRIRGTKLSSKLGSAFGLIYNDVYLSLADRCYDFVRDEFERYIVQNWEGPLALRNRRLSECTLLEHRWLSYSKAAQKTGLPENFLRRMHLSGELDAREFRYSCGKTVVVVDIEEARRLSAIVHEPLNLRQTSRLLCVSRKRVEQLIKSGVLNYVGGSPHAGEKWFVDFSSIISLAPPRFLPYPSDNFITISQAAKHYLPTSGGLPELVMAIQSGTIPVFCRAEKEALNIGKWLFDPNELEKNSITSLTSSYANGMSVSQAAKTLGVKDEVAYALVRLGRLRSETVQSSRRPAQLISLQSIKHFERNYILSPEIARILGTHVVNVQFHLQAGGFSPIAGPNILSAPCRQNVWRRGKKLMAYISTTANIYDLVD